MNKYTLTFESSELEEQYQKEYDTAIRYPLTLLLLGFGILFAIGQSIVSLALSELNQDFWLRIAFILISIAGIVISNKYKSISQIILVIIVLIIQAQLIFVGEASQIEINSICNTIMIHISVAYLVEFKLSLIDTFIGTFGQFYAIYYYTGLIPIGNILHTVTHLALFIFTRYKLELINRNKFLYTLKDKEWNEVLEKILLKPYFLFHFDKNKFQFELKTAGKLFFKCQNTDDLKDFLRKANIKDQTFEKVLFNYLNEEQDRQVFTYNQRKLQLNYEKVKYQITLTRSFVIHDCFLVLFDEDSELIKKIKIQEMKKMLSMQKKIQINLYNTISVLKDYLKTKEILPLKQYIIQETQKLLNFRISLNSKQLSLQHIAIESILWEIEMLTSKSLIYQDSRQVLKRKLQTNVSLLYLFFLKLMKFLKFNQIIVFVDAINDREVCLTFQNNQISECCLRYEKWNLQEKYKVILKNAQIIMNEDQIYGISFVIIDQPDISFQ